MPRQKKMTKEELNQEIARQVEERQKVWRAEQEYESKKKFIDRKSVV